MFVVGVVEVTIPWDGRVEAARAEKRQTYSPLVEALSGNIFEKEKKWSLFMGINIHFKSDILFFNVYFSARTRTPVRFISIEIGSFNQRLSESSRMAVRELYSFTKQVCFSF